jgi:rubredoxin
VVSYPDTTVPPRDPEPIPMLLWCPACRHRHLDEGEFATKAHHTHACQHCGMVWRPALVPTVGVEFLPGFRNDDDPDRATPANPKYLGVGRLILCGARAGARVCTMERGHGGVWHDDGSACWPTEGVARG